MSKLLYLVVLLCPTGVFIPFCAAVSPSAAKNVSRAHYYLYPDKLEPTPSKVEWYTSSATTAGGAPTGWSSSSTTEYGWNTISPTNAGWPSSSTTDYSGWATPTPSPPGWSSPTPPPPPPPNNGWSTPSPAPPPNSGWATPAPPPPPPPNNGWTAPTPPPQNNGWSTPAPVMGWSPPTPPPTSSPGGWTPAPPPPTPGWMAPTPGWMAPGGCNTADCVFLENNIVSNILNSSTYYKQLRPPPYDNPTLVSVDVFIKNILFVNDEDKLWKAQLTLRQQWNDPRLAYSTQGCSQYKHFTLTSTDSIWTPDLFFPLEEEASYHQVPQRNVLVWIAPNGDVTYSTRITLTMNCRGRKTQTELICPLIIGSYAYSSEKMRLQWLQPDPVQIDLDRIDLPNYSVGKVATSGNGDPTAYLGQFPGVVAKFTFIKKQSMCRYG